MSEGLQRRSALGKSTTGVALASATAVIWGGQFVVGKSALGHVDAFHLTAIRYLVAGALFLVVLVAVEGVGALRLDGMGLRLWVLGSLGFAGFNLALYTGLAHAPAESASLIATTGPLVTALVLWARDGIRPTRVTVSAIVVALAGVALVISHGQPGSLLTGAIGWGDGLVLVGVVCFVFYTLGAVDTPGLSPLRYTTLTAALGWTTIAAATAVVTVAGLEPMPSASAVEAILPELAYLAIPGAVVAVLAWNAAVGMIGPQNVTLLGCLIPISTFTIEIARGYRPAPLELAGAAITIGALVVSNLLGRRGRAEVLPVDEADGHARHRLAPARGGR